MTTPNETFRFRGWSGVYTIQVGAQLFRGGRNVAPSFTDVDKGLAALAAAGIEVVAFDRVTYTGTAVRKCPYRRELRTPRRPVNGLNVEIGSPQDRCMLRSPDGRGLAWVLSGGSALAYGYCYPNSCPRGAPCSGRA